MSTTNHLVRVLALVALLAIAVAACGGSASPAPTGSGSPQTAEPTDAPTDAPTDEPSVSLPPGLDVDDATSGLDDLDSYQLDISVAGLVPSASGASGVTLTAIVDRENDATDFTMSGFEGLATAGDAFHVIVIGNDAWLDVGTGQFIAQPGGANSFTGLVDSLAPEDLLTTIPESSLSSVIEVGPENKNGVATTHYRLDSSVPGFADSLGEDGTADIWIAVDGGYLVSMTMSGTSETNGEMVDVEMSFDVSRINDPSIDIQPPS
jgi:hypothetical protein